MGIAKVVKALGGGRTIKTDALDYGVGVILHHSEGDAIQAGQALLDLWVGASYSESLETSALEAFVIV
jgi:thymidine phosphorylase